MKLIIVGNGFDIAHNLETGYLDFYENLDSEIKIIWESLLEEFRIDSNDWYSFEEAINKLTEKWHHKYFESYAVENTLLETQDILLEKVQQINEVFSDLTEQLFLYISNEEKKSVELKKSIQDILSPESYVLTFNYTNLMKRYCKNIYHIHGSIAEEYIVLGYKLRAEQVGMAFEATKYNKSKLREKLNFRRFLQQNSLSNSDILLELEEFDKHVDCLSSGRGGYRFDYSKEIDSQLMAQNSTVANSNCSNSSIPYKELEQVAREERLKQMSKYINAYGEINNFQTANIDTKIPYEQIDEIVILGHSLKADIEIFDDLFPRIPNLKTVVLFTYNGENTKELEQKKEVLRKLTPCPIVEKFYD